MRRREFIAGLGAVVWPLAAGAQQGERVRRIGVLTDGDENDPEQKRRFSAFTQAFAGLGWTDGRDVRIDLRWGGGDINRIRALAQELVGLQPDVIFTNGAAATVAVQRETRTIPIVFANESDPVASGIVPRLDRPSGNITGFASNEATLGGKCHGRASRGDRIGGRPKQGTGGLCAYRVCQRRRLAAGAAVNTGSKASRIAIGSPANLWRTEMPAWALEALGTPSLRTLNFTIIDQRDPVTRLVSGRPRILQPAFR
jgi:ABC transporter substrate binding protein